MTDHRLYPATRAGLQAKAEAKWAERRAGAKREIAELLDVLTTPLPVVAPEKGFMRFGDFWIGKTSFVDNMFDRILTAAVFANEVGETVYVEFDSTRWLVVPPFGDVTLWDAYMNMSKIAKNDESRARGFRDEKITAPSDLPFDAWEARYAMASPDVRDAMDRDRAR